MWHHLGDTNPRSSSRDRNALNHLDHIIKLGIGVGRDNFPGDDALVLGGRLGGGSRLLFLFLFLVALRRRDPVLVRGKLLEVDIDDLGGPVNVFSGELLNRRLEVV